MIQQHEINILKNVIEKAEAIQSQRLVEMAQHIIKEITAELPKNEDDAITAHETDNDDGYLLGSSVQPAVFKLADGSEMILGDVVARAHTNSGLLASAWNAMDDAAREEHIAAEVGKLDLAVNPTTMPPAGYQFLESNTETLGLIPSDTIKTGAPDSDGGLGTANPELPGYVPDTVTAPAPDAPVPAPLAQSDAQ